MSYELKIDPMSRAAGRFIGKVRKELVSAVIEEKNETGINQQKIADKLGVNRSVINRLLKGDSNLTLRSIAEIAWALGWEPVFTLRRKAKIAADKNHHIIDVTVPANAVITTSTANVARSSSTTPIGAQSANRKELSYAG